MIIEYLSLFVSWVDSFLSLQLHHILHSSFIIQMLRCIRVSSRVDSFIFLIAWGIFFGWWELDLQFLPSSLLYYESSFFFFPESTESNHFLLAHIPWMNESHDPGRPFKVAITTLHSSLLLLPLQVVLLFERLLWLHGLCILDLHILQLVS